MTDKVGRFAPGTAEAWIVSAASLFIVCIVGFLARHAWTTLTSLDVSMNTLDRRFIAVESSVQSIQMQLVDIPNMKLDQARQDVRMEQLTATVKELESDLRRTR